MEKPILETDKSQIEIYSLHWKCPSELSTKNWDPSARSTMQEFLTRVEMVKLYEYPREIC
jgi:hypothetical protein